MAKEPVKSTTKTASEPGDKPEAAVSSGSAEAQTASTSGQGSQAPASEAGPVKTTEAAATQLVRDAVETNTDRTDEPASAELKQETIGERTVMPIAAAAPSVNANPGTLPATARVMANGSTVELSRTANDRTEKMFTAKVRILRNKTLYEPGAPVPLTLSEFEAKRDRGSIVESYWMDGGSAEARPQ